MLFRRRKNLLKIRSSQALHLFRRKGIKQAVVIIKAYHCYKIETKFYPAFFLQG
jgi:hypothetical protein